MKMVKKLLLLAFQNSGRRRPVALTHRITSFSSSAAAVVVDDDVRRRFQELSDLHPMLKTNIRHDEMTEIQAKTYDAASEGADVLGRARTGTGKTVGFLLPAMQRLLFEKPPMNGSKHIRMLILSPTRELAVQIGKQVNELSMNTGMSHQVIVGGSSKPKDVKLFERSVPNVLVATPGRLNDHLKTTEIRGKSFSALLKGLDVLVLDEMDRCVFRNSQQSTESDTPSTPDSSIWASAKMSKRLSNIYPRSAKHSYSRQLCPTA